MPQSAEKSLEQLLEEFAAGLTAIVQNTVTIQDGGGSITVDSPQLPAALGSGGGIKVDQNIPLGPITVAGTEERLTMAAAHQHATIPAGTQFVRIAAESGDIRWTLAGDASATSAGYLPSGTVEWIGLPAGAALSVYGAVGSFANLVYGKVV